MCDRNASVRSSAESCLYKTEHYCFPVRSLFGSQDLLGGKRLQDSDQVFTFIQTTFNQRP